MSSDNFWYVKGNRVYMGNASDFSYLSEEAMKQVEADYKKRLLARHPYHEAANHQEARNWAQEEYAEYGTYWIDEDDA